MPPQPAAPWPGVREALEFADAAPQAPNSNPIMRWYYALNSMSEDCLYLNVYAPSPGALSRKPVMVWLHGGAWWIGSGAAPGFDGANLAQYGDVVVITLTHRLNLFGFLQLEGSSERFADAGNAGLLDIISALRWVRDNVSAFGGDPHNVTIFGQSGGGAKVCALMAAPAAKGLFHKAIAQSCSGNLRIADQGEAAAMARALAAQFELPKADGEALQSIPLDHLLRALTVAPRPYRPALDGRTLLRHPFDPDAPPTSADIPFLTGNAANETRLAMASDLRNFALDEAQAKQRLAAFMQIDASEAGLVVGAYQSAYADASPSDLLALATTDYMYVRNTTRAALLQAAHAPVYVYLFNWRTPAMQGVLGAPHTVEVPFIFGTAAAAAALLGQGEELPRLTQMMMSTWSSFARTGDPNNATLPHWPRYRSPERHTMLLDIASRVEACPGAEARAVLDRFAFYDYGMPASFI